jgi:transcriptional regulator with XRE-family HTH domain
MVQLDKQAMGRRIRQIRIRRGLRQWELARLLGTTQSAIHKYEHGVIPEPRRLVEMSRIGGTSVEWILTGEHWLGGSADQSRPDDATLRIAALLRELADDERERLQEALRIIRAVVLALREGESSPPDSPERTLAALHDHAEDASRLLDSAWRIQQAVLQRLCLDARQRLTDAAPTWAEPAG